VTAAVKSYAGAAEQGDGAPGADDALNGPISEDEVLEALLDLNNGKAASPHTGMPNDLLKPSYRHTVWRPGHGKASHAAVQRSLGGSCAAPDLDYGHDTVFLPSGGALRYGELSWHHPAGRDQQAVPYGAGR
jgi:hypothetical protein